MIPNSYFKAKGLIQGREKSFYIDIHNLYNKTFQIFIPYFSQKYPEFCVSEWKDH